MCDPTKYCWCLKWLHLIDCHNSISVQLRTKILSVTPSGYSFGLNRFRLGSNPGTLSCLGSQALSHCHTNSRTKETKTRNFAGNTITAQTLLSYPHTTLLEVGKLGERTASENMTLKYCCFDFWNVLVCIVVHLHPSFLHPLFLFTLLIPFHHTEVNKVSRMDYPDSHGRFPALCSASRSPPVYWRKSFT